MQKTFFSQVKAPSSVIEDMGNPLSDESRDLLIFDTRDIVDSSVVDAMYNLKAKRQQQYDLFVTEWLNSLRTPLNDPICRNKYPLFSCKNCGRSPE